MRWLNYHHLLYFWTVARTGSIVAASRELFVSQPAISTQIKALEAELGAPLFERAGRGLALTASGRTAYEYADHIFRLGSELRTALGPATDAPKLRLGIGTLTPKLLAPTLLAPMLSSQQTGVRLEVREASAEALFQLLSARELDCVLSDDERFFDRAGAPRSERMQKVEYALFASTPPSEHPDDPMILPLAGTPLRARLDTWLEAQKRAPRVVAECEDGAMMLELGRAGLGTVAAPKVLAPSLTRSHGLHLVTPCEGVFSELYLHTTHAFRRHPAVEWMLRGLPDSIMVPEAEPVQNSGDPCPAPAPTAELRPE